MTPLQSVSSIKLPNVVLAKAAGKSKAHRTLVTLALNRSLKPVLPGKEEIIHLSISLHVDMIAKVQLVAKEHGLSFSAAFASLANAGLQHLLGKEGKEAAIKAASKNLLESQLLLSAEDEDRPRQKDFWLKMATGLHLNKVVMAEGTTGVGKGRAIISAAIMCAKAGKFPVLVCAPTIKVLAQLFQQEFLNNEAAKKAAKKFTLAFLPGKQEFISEKRLREYLADNPCPDVEKWVAAGGPNREATALAVAAKYAGIKLSWLTADLRVVAGDKLRADDFSLSETDKKDLNLAGAQQLAALIEYARSADIVFLTHAMLARLATSMWGGLPSMREKDPDTNKPVNTPVIIIDEAHLFEEAMSAATANELSLFSLRYRLERETKASSSSAGSAPARAAKITRELMNLARELNDEDRTLVLRSGTPNRPEKYNQRVNNQILSLLRDLSSELGKRGAISKIEGIAEDRGAISSVIKGLETGANRVQLSYSPQRRFPSILSGKASVGNELSLVWATARGGAALVSATLWLPDWKKNERVSYMREVLHLPLDRMDTPSSIIWDEVYKSPTLYLPDKAIAEGLVPPAEQTEENLDAWCKRQAGIIASFNKECAGGSLVLCTSYAQIRSLKDALVAKGIKSKRIVENSGRLAEDQAKFTELHRSDMHPLWLALGPAWAGVDLLERNAHGRDVPANHDYLLSDLIITRLPIGLNRTLTMDARMSRDFMTVNYDALLRLKQGLGRLIRRAGLKNRRILVLDGRLTCDPALNTRFIQQVVAGAHSLLENYKIRKVIR